METPSSSSTSSSSFSSANVIEDIVRLIAPYERAAFREMLQSEVRGQGVRDHAQRR